MSGVHGEIDKSIVLSGGDFQLLLKVYKRIERKYSVNILMPPESLHPTRSTDIVNTIYSGSEENVVAAMMFCESFVFNTRPTSFKYPRKLNVLFTYHYWINLLEELHDVLIVNQLDENMLTVMGPEMRLVVSMLEMVAASLSMAYLHHEDTVHKFHKSMRVVQSSSVVPDCLKNELKKVTGKLPLDCNTILLSWLEHYHQKKTEERETLGDSVILLDDSDIIVLKTPEKEEPPLVVISDDDDDDVAAACPSSDAHSNQKVAFAQTRAMEPDTSSPSVVCVYETGSNVGQRRKYHVMQQAPKGRVRKRPSKKNPVFGNKKAATSHAYNNSDDIAKTQTLASIQNGDLERNNEPVIRSLSPKLRPIVIDGSNVAVAHGVPSKVFSCRGIKICIDYFLSRGHTDITAFVPQFRQRTCGKNGADQKILFQLAETQRVVFTPSRKINGKTISSYDDRYIVRLACEKQGVIVSNDHFRDLLHECKEWRETIEKRLLMFCFVGDIFMIPDDPLGKNGPNINEFLSFPNEDNK